jgi:fructose-1,6-bisphosphatase/inositol monophosphatase family enzyme
MAHASQPIPPADVERYHACALELADEARRIIVPALERGFSVQTKPDASLVTEVDQAVERRMRERIEGWFPDHGVIGEEYPPTRPDAAFQWILDPIDGTEEFVHGIPLFGAMLALHHRGVPLVGVIDHPALDLRVNAGVGLGAYRNGQRLRLAEAPPSTAPERLRLVLSARKNFTRHADDGHLFDSLTREFPNHRIYRAAYAHTAAVMGAVDGMVAMHNHVWDLAPSQVLIEEAGGAYTVVRDLAAPDGRLVSAVLGKRAVVERLRAVVAAHDAPRR